MTAYVVTRPYPDSNVGSNLSSLAGALWLADRLDRELVVDWRGMRQLRDPSLNYFAEFFARPDSMVGVPVHYAPFPELDEGSGDGSTACWLSPDEARALGAGEERVTEPFVVLQPYHGLDRLHPGPEAERFRFLRAVYRSISPGHAVAAAVEDYARAALSDAGFVIGLNVRTGNGHYFGPGMRYEGRIDTRLFARDEAFLRLLERACRSRLRAVPPEVGSSFQIFFATDSGRMSELLGALPNAVTRRGVFPPSGAGDLYAFGEGEYDDRAAVVDTLADMFLLARCDALVWNFSLFNQYARVVTGYFGGNAVPFESLTARRRLRGAASKTLRRAWH